MRNKIQKFRGNWKADYQYSTIFSSAVATLTALAFTAFNGVLGIVYHSLWNGSICVYYLLLAMVRAIIVRAQKKELLYTAEAVSAHRRKVSIGTHLLLLIMDISLIVPIAVMVKGERSYTYGLIPAIAMAAYTTYRITLGIIHLRKSRKSDNIFILELRMINFSDSLIALLTLQNALIIANGGMNDDMKTLVTWTSAGVYIAIAVITILSFIKAKKVPQATVCRRTDNS